MGKSLSFESARAHSQKQQAEAASRSRETCSAGRAGAHPYRAGGAARSYHSYDAPEIKAVVSGHKYEEIGCGRNWRFSLTLHIGDHVVDRGHRDIEFTFDQIAQLEYRVRRVGELYFDWRCAAPLPIFRCSTGRRPRVASSGRTLV